MGSAASDASGCSDCHTDLRETIIMAQTKSRKFRSNLDTGVTVYATDASGNSIPIRVEPDTTFETDEKHLIAALKGSPEVRELKDKS
jgi:hypothetical protein